MEILYYNNSYIVLYKHRYKEGVPAIYFYDEKLLIIKFYNK